MKATRILTVLVVVVVMMGCAGAQFVKETKLSNGALVVQGGRTGAFGTDNSFVQIVPASGSQAEKVRLEKIHTKSAISWTGCPDRKKGADGYWKPNRRAKNIKRSEQEEYWSEEVLANGQQANPSFAAFGNESTGNAAVPAAVSGALLAGGMIGAASVLRPASTNINTQSSGGNATGGAGGAGGLGVGVGHGGAGGDGGSSSSSASSAAAAAASASSAAAAD